MEFVHGGIDPVGNHIGRGVVGEQKEQVSPAFILLLNDHLPALAQLASPLSNVSTQLLPVSPAILESLLMRGHTGSPTTWAQPQ